MFVAGVALGYDLCLVKKKEKTGNIQVVINFCGE